MEDTPVYPTPAALNTAALAPAPRPLNAAEKHYLNEVHQTLPVSMSDFLHDYHHRLEAQAADLRRELTEARAAHAAAVASHRVEVLDILRDMRLPMLPPSQANADGPRAFVQGQNKERQAINDYCRQKAYEYSPEGIGPDPVKVGEWDTLPAAGAGKEGGAAK